jgi:2-dehydropantoate 2-reductase
MDVAILGSGAMGSLLGARLAEAGHAVTLVDAWAEHVRAMTDDGLRLTTAGTDERIEVTATTDPSGVPPPDLLVVFVKSIHTGTALADAGPLLGPDVDVLTLQNGLGNAETIAEFVPRENVIAGVTAHGATLEAPGHVYHAGSGPTTIGRYFAATDERVREVAAALTAAGFQTSVADEIRDAIWGKVLVNVGVNAPTALARVENGLLAATAPGRRIVETAVTEAAAVARAEGRAVDDDVVTEVLEVAEATGTNRSSMLQDVEAERRTEIDRIHGAVVDRADDAGVAVPVNRLLADLVRLAERGYGAKG